MLSEKIWGMELNQIDPVTQTYGVTIKRAIWRAGETVKVGLNRKLVDTLIRRKADLIIKVLDPKAEFSIPAFKIRKIGQVYINRSAPSGNMPMIAVEIPRKCYKDRK